MVKKSETFTESLLDKDPWNKAVDFTIGCLYLICFTFGVPNNVTSFCFFARRCWHSRPSMSTYLHSITSLQDTVISILVLYNGLIMLRNRDPWDSLPVLCSVHYILFAVSEKMAVFLVTALSLTRSYGLVYPMRKISIRSILTGLAITWIFLACSTGLPTLLGWIEIEFHPQDGYCWPEIEDSTLRAIFTTLNMVGITTPIIPILVSCVISLHEVKRSQRTKFGSLKMTKQGRKKLRRTNHQMTLTIILVTLLYILLKIPFFINYLLYLISILLGRYPGLFHQSPTMKFYSWNVTFMLCTAINTVTNPIIYLTRFKRYRQWLRRCWGRRGGLESSYTSRGVYMMSSTRMVDAGQSEYRSNIMPSTADD